LALNEQLQNELKGYHRQFNSARQEIDKKIRQLEAQNAAKLQDSRERHNRKIEKQRSDCQQQRESLDAQLQSKHRTYEQVTPENAVSHLERTPEMQAEFSRKRALLRLLQTEIDRSEVVFQNQMSKFGEELAALEKAKRQLLRRIETEARQVDDEFERKIQIEQVTLSQKIDNISKLYTLEENQRGREVIEMMRKVNETRMRVDQLLESKARQLEELQNQNALADQITEGAEATGKLRGQILKSEVETKERLAEIEQTKVAKIREIEGATKEIETAHRANLAQIRQESDQILHKVQSGRTEIERNITKVTEEKHARLLALQSSGDSRRAELVQRHESKVGELTKQLDALRNAKTDLEAANSAAVTQFFLETSKAIEAAFEISICHHQTAAVDPVRSSSKAAGLREKREELLAVNGDICQKFLALISLLEAGRVPEKPRTPLRPILRDA
jgi:hypothetical protein